uniref:Peptidase S1 domain-containing protein n=1 Tax=Timema tahoe TaxID=61484 RepID=A0A7R9IJH6_9NEOP|nr:unnamed protein product [Timema tahoe]
MACVASLRHHTWIAVFPGHHKVSIFRVGRVPLHTVLVCTGHCARVYRTLCSCVQDTVLVSYLLPGLCCWNGLRHCYLLPGSGTSRLDPVETCQSINDCIPLLLLQAAVLPDWTQLKPVNLYVPEDTVVRSPQEWEEIYARQELRPLTPIEVVGAVPQPAEAGKTSVTHTPDPRIIGGASAARGQFPWQAYLILGGSGLCGGSIISSSWILTAAHCLQGFDTFSVTLGSTSRAVAQVGSHTQVSRLAIIHAQYSGLLIRNDIGLIRLDSAVTFSDVIIPVRLPGWSQSTNTFANQPATVSGFGLTVGGGSAASAILNYADVTIIANSVCSRSFPLNLRDSNICTSDARSGPCNGDSGGPLVIREADGIFTEVGIVSFGSRDCPVGSPAAFVRVTSYLDWISINTGLSILTDIELSDNRNCCYAGTTVCVRGLPTSQVHADSKLITWECLSCHKKSIMPPKLRANVRAGQRLSGPLAAVLPDWTQLKPVKSINDCIPLRLLQAAAAVLPDWTQLKPVNLYVPEDTSGEVTSGMGRDLCQTGAASIDPHRGAEAGKTSVTHTPDPRIIGGASAARGQFPWQAYLILGGSGLCGGSIISSSWILTAAHCLQGFDTFSVTLGSTSRAVAQVGSHTQVSRLAIIHAQYSGLLIRNDIGLIRLNHDVLFSDVIAPVRLPSWSQSANSFSGYPAIVSGFGLTVGGLLSFMMVASFGNTYFTPNPVPPYQVPEGTRAVVLFHEWLILSPTGGSTASATLNYADVAIISNTACSATFPLNLRESNICTSSTNGKSPCNGDSGGPLVILETDGLYTEVGIVSFGTRDCPVGSPAAFTRVTSFLDWISINTGLSIRA